MAEDLTVVATPVPAGDPPPGVTERARRRFTVAFVALGAVLVVAAALAAGMFTALDRPSPFSSLVADADDPVAKMQQVADQVSAEYVTASGKPIVTVNAGEDDSPAQPGATQIVSVESNPPGVASFEQGNIVFFRMCAAGTNCALPADLPPDVAFPILATEAHELALEAFNALGGPAFVMVILPPGLLSGPDPAKIPRAVSFFRREDLASELDGHLADVIPEPRPTPETLSPAEAAGIQAREAARFYQLTGSGPDPTNTSRIYVLTR